MLGQWTNQETAPGFKVSLHGRLRGIPRKRLGLMLAAAGGELTTRLAAAGFVAVSRSSAPSILGAQALPASIPRDAALLSDLTLRRWLRLSPAAPVVARTLGTDDMVRGAKIDDAHLRWLVLFDVLDPIAGAFSYEDLLVAREAARLLAEGLQLGEIVLASHRLATSGQRLTDTPLTRSIHGEIFQSFGDQLGELDGQLVLPLAQGESPSVDEVFAMGEAAEASGDVGEAERCYALALSLDRTDPVIPFNLGNVLAAQGRQNEAVAAYRQALSRDPRLAEAWYNLALVAQERGETAEATRCFREAVLLWPDYPEALLALGQLLTRQDNFAEALPILDRYLALELSPKQIASARRYATLCRLGLA